MYKIDSQLTKRLKSFIWRGAMMTFAFFTAWCAENIGLLELPPTAVMFLGLALGELSKWLNTQVR